VVYESGPEAMRVTPAARVAHRAVPLSGCAGVWPKWVRPSTLTATTVKTAVRARVIGR
jgi:hypothetical protein